MERRITRVRLGLTKLGLVVLLLFVTGCASASRGESARGLHHVGLIWLKEPGNLEHRQRIIAAAHSFAREIPEVELLSVGQAPPSTSSWVDDSLVDDSFDVCFVMRLEDGAALERYARHPVHERAAREVFLPLSERILFYDFTAE